MTKVEFRPRFGELLRATLIAERRSPFNLVAVLFLYCYMFVFAFRHGQEIAAERGLGSMLGPVVLAVVGTSVLVVLGTVALAGVADAVIAFWVYRTAKSSGVSIVLGDDAIRSAVGSRPRKALPYRRARVHESGDLLVICAGWMVGKAMYVPARAFPSHEEREAFRNELGSRMSGA